MAGAGPWSLRGVGGSLAGPGARTAPTARHEGAPPTPATGGRPARARRHPIPRDALAGVRIRRARPGDAPVIARLANALNRHEHLPQRFTPAIVRRDALGRRRRFRVLIAEVDRQIVGYASVIAGYNTDLAAPELWMLDLFVVAGWRGHGVGRALVRAVAREAVRRRITSLGWGVRGTNARARRFYRSLGARIGDVRVAALTGRALRALAAAR